LKKFTLSLIACATALTFPAVAAYAVPYPTKNTPKAVDVGSFAAVASQEQQTVTVAMKLRDFAGAQAALAAVTTPGSPSYHKFLTPEQFDAQFGPRPEDVATVISALNKLGLTATKTGTTALRVTGTPAALQSAFSVELHQFQVAGHDNVPGYTYHAPTSPAVLPAAIAPLVHAVIGLDTRPRLSPHMTRSFAKTTKLKSPLALQRPKAAPGNAPGYLTVTDFASHYNVTPLYSATPTAITGAGKTLAIVTLASFTPSDAYAYWTAVGLTVNPNRITEVDVDGGHEIPPSDASGSDETTLDVEQSGGIAYGANVLVYEAPNTSQGFLDAFVQAVQANTAETISTSWGEWEWFDTVAGTGGTVNDPNGQQVSELKAFDEIFLQAAVQGQSLFASAGDSGAYDVNEGQAGILPPTFSLALSVDSPASDPYMTAAGGTTLPGTQQYGPPGAPGSVTINVAQEQVWGWQYLTPLCASSSLSDEIACGIFPVGGGGGVSIEYSRPTWQYLVSGPQLSQPKQALTEYDITPPVTYYKLPANFAGRNLPDISANADPQTGYEIYYTSDQSGFEILTYIGGTSFVAPQLNGVASLLNQSTNSRLGLLNMPLYYAAASGGYKGNTPSLVAITAGNNWFYSGSNGYNPGAGLGILNVANFASFLKTSPYK
jgi:subtilase family serine protease